MATLVARLKDHGYNNWVKGGLSLGVAKDGIENFVEKNTDQFHQDVLNNVLAGANCRNCSTENVIPCNHNNNFCKFVNRACTIHDSSDPYKRSKQCPVAVCDNIRLEIIKEHRFNGPAWRNTDCQSWCREPWQLAKCFMSQGYESSTSAADTDFPGLLSVIINHKMFDNLVTDNLASKNNVFCQARDVRNMILHNADMKLTDQELQDCISTLKNMLSDPRCLSVHPDALKAKDMLDKILNDQINITTEDERQVRALREIELQKQEALAKIKDEKEEVRNELTEAKDVIKVEKEEVRKELTEAKDVIKVEKKEVRKELTEAKEVIKVEKEEVRKELTEAKDVIKVEKEEVRKELTEAKEVIKVEKEEVRKELTEAKDVIKVEKEEVRKELTEAKDVIKVEKEEVRKELSEAKEVIKVEKEEVRKELTEAKDVIKIEKEEVRKELTEAKEVIKVEKEEVRKELTEAKEVIKVEKEEVRKELTEAKEVIKVEKEEVRKELTETKDVIKVEKEEVRKELTEAKEVIKVEKEEVRKELTEAKDVIKVEKEEVRKELTEAKDVIKVEKEEVKKELTKAKEEAIASLQTATQDTCSMKKKDMKAHLISIYQRDEQLSSPLFPLELSDQRKIDELYVKPNMKLKDEPTKHKDEPIDSYKDLFKDERRKIYVVGDAGLGKTSLCQKMVSTWCRVQAETIEDMSDDELALGKFDFLFYISLREAATENDVEDMIKVQLLAEEFHELLPTVLKNEKVLVILDGLDEWSGDSKVCKRLVNKGIPTIRIMGNGTVLTTTRPWKLEAIQLKSTQIDAKVELLGVSDVSAEKLIQIMINQLNMENKSHKKMKDFISKLNHKRLGHFMTIPVVLKQLICLWHSGKQLGGNICTIYGQMLELLFELGQTRLEKDPKHIKKKVEWINSSIELPDCFNETDQCQGHKPLILALGKVAFQTLLSENKESSLVFKRSQAEIHGMTAEDINICLNIGILSQSGVIKNTRAHRKISFLHKTYQEFLAALFLSVNQTESDECFQTIQRECKSELEVFDILFKFTNIMSSETTCKMIAHIRPVLDIPDTSSFLIAPYQHFLISCLNKGWNCSHDNQHLKCDRITIYYGSRSGRLGMDGIYVEYSQERVDLLVQVNIQNMKSLKIQSQPTAQCLGYLLQVTTLESLYVGNILCSRSPFSSEPTLYDLIQNNKNTLTGLEIFHLTLSSRTKLITLLNNIPHLSSLGIVWSILSRQLLDSLQDLKAQIPDIEVNIQDSTILPDTECTD